jgi:predicted RNA-binding protein Jag|tara:strand:- start:1128 stop:1619 length:492 start_codon:yes stop_codon:yes gene_type:complete
MAQRFYSQLDLDTFDRFNRELVGDVVNEKDGIIFQQVEVYKISAKDTKTNIYGETVGGKVYEAGVQIASLVDAEDQTTNTDEFGPDRVQNVSFSFLRKTLRDIEFVVDVGDIVNWNDGFWEITSKNENQLVGGQTDANYIHSVVCSAYLTRISHLNIERVRSI